MNKIIVESPCYISVTDKNYLKIQVLTTKDQEKKEPITKTFDSFDVLLLESDRSTITIKAINQLIKNNILLITCNSNHIPFTTTLGISNHYQPYKNLNAQLKMKSKIAGQLWYEIIKAKLENQKLVMEFIGIDKDIIERVERLIRTIEIGDVTNREGIVAKMFFRSLYGSDFIRRTDTFANILLNYGYSIFTALIARLIVAQGLTPMKGIHHKNESNYWNLAYDLVEVIRPLIDYWVASHLAKKKHNKIEKEDKAELLELLNCVVSYDGQNRVLSSAIKDYITSFTQSIVKNNAELIKTPRLIKQKW